MGGKLFVRVSLAVVAGLLAVSLAISMLTRPSASYAARVIEYKVVPIRTPQTAALQAALDQHGKDGWELITVDIAGGNLIFKR